MGLQGSFSASLSSYSLILAKLLERRAHQDNCLHAILVCRMLVALQDDILQEHLTHLKQLQSIL